MTDSFSQTEEDKSSMATAPDSPSGGYHVGPCSCCDGQWEVFSPQGAPCRWSSTDKGLVESVCELLNSLQPTPSPTEAVAIPDATPQGLRETGAAGQLSALREALNWLHQRCKQCRCMGSDGWHEFCAFETETLKPLLAVPQSEPQVCGCILFGNHTVKLCESHWLALTPPFPHEAAAAPKPATPVDYCERCKAGITREYRTVKMPAPYGGTGWWHYAADVNAWFTCQLQGPAPACEAPPLSDIIYRMRREADTVLSPPPMEYGKAWASALRFWADEFERALAASVPPPPSRTTDWRWMRLRGYLRQWLTPHQFEIALDCMDKAEGREVAR